MSTARLLNQHQYVAAVALRSRWPEPLGADRGARLSRLYQQGRRYFHESIGTADEAVSHSTEAIQQRLNGWQVDTPDPTGPARCRISRQRYLKHERGIAPCESRQLPVVDDIRACAGRVQERCGHSAA